MVDEVHVDRRGTIGSQPRDKIPRESGPGSTSTAGLAVMAVICLLFLPTCTMRPPNPSTGAASVGPSPFAVGSASAAPEVPGGAAFLAYCQDAATAIDLIGDPSSLEGPVAKLRSDTEALTAVGQPTERRLVPF